MAHNPRFRAPIRDDASPFSGAIYLADGAAGAGTLLASLSKGPGAPTPAASQAPGGPPAVFRQGIVGTAGDDILTGSFFIWGDDGNDIISASSNNDWLFGEGGNDVLDGRTASDVMTGGLGDDVFYVDAWNYTVNPNLPMIRDDVVEAIGEGYDRVFVTTTWWQVRNAEIEFLYGVQFIDGNDRAQTIYGTLGRQIIVANGGNDILNGFEDNDQLRGGGGADTFVFSTPLGSNQTDEILDFNPANDVIELVGGPGGIFSTLSPGAVPAAAFTNGSAATTAEHRILYTGGGVLYYDPDGNGAAEPLPFAVLNGVPALTAAAFIVTAAVATAGNDNLVGTAGPDNLVGYAGDDSLDGGAGVDATFGGAGNDIHYIDQPADMVIERIGQGSADEVRTAISYLLGSLAEVEILRTTNDAGTAAINLIGNNFNNTIYGNAGDNVLIGGAGNDFLFGWVGNNILVGGAGNDTFHIGYGADTVTGEGAADGLDTIRAGSDYTLAEGLYIEVLSTDFHDGTAAIALGGNALNNVIYGNAGNNILYGKGGNDWLEGLGGDDSYYVDSAGDYVREIAGGGNDRIFAGADYTLYAGQQVEILSTDWNAGTAAIVLGGNELDNIIFGNDGNNILYGKGGSDTLLGGGGNDQFWFNTALGATNVDTIYGFVSGADKLVLFKSVFAGLGSGGFSANAFVTGSAAQDADDRIVYNSATGALLYDADGNGAGAAVQFATLNGAPIINAGDFSVF